MKSFFYAIIYQDRYPKSTMIFPSLVYKGEKFTEEELQKYSKPFENVLRYPASSHFITD
jgi:hypothetical protein